MAISGYSSHRRQKRGVYLLYAVVAVVIIAAMFLIFNPSKGKKKNESKTVAGNNLPAQTQQAKYASPAKTTTAAPIVSEPKTHSGTEAEKTDLSSYAAENQVGHRTAALIKSAQTDIDAGRIIAARNTLNDVLNMQLPVQLRDSIKSRMTRLAQQWLFSGTVFLGDDLCTTYQVRSGDMLSTIAQKYKIPYQFIMKINNITNARSLQVGQNLKVVKGPFHCIIYCSSFKMDVYLQNVYVKTYRVGLGRKDKSTPIGLWRVAVGGKLIKPTWTDPDTGQTFTADNPNYPLGSGWIALEGIDPKTRNITGIALHGTKDENSISTRSSRGCIRLYNGELKEVYNMLEPGFSEVRTVK